MCTGVMCRGKKQYVYVCADANMCTGEGGALCAETKSNMYIYIYVHVYVQMQICAHALCAEAKSKMYIYIYIHMCRCKYVHRHHV